MNKDTFMCSSDEKQTRSPLSLYSEYQRMEIEFRAPHIMPTSHWHGQVEVNVPFDGDVEYLINNEKVSINQGHITLFWACTPHQRHCCKVSDEAAFCLIQRPYISKTLLTRRISPRGSP